MIAAVRTITVKDMRQRLRDKSFFLVGIVTPFVLAIIFDLVFGGLGGDELEVRAGVVDADQSEISGRLYEGVSAIDGEGGVTIVTFDGDSGTGPDGTSDGELDVRSAIDEQGLDAVIVIPEGFGADVTSGGGQAPRLRVVADPDRPIQVGIVESIADGLVTDIERSRLAAGAGQQLGTSTEPALQEADLDLHREWPGGEGLDTGSRMLAGMVVMFVFFTVSFGVTTLLSEKETGTMRRLLAAPIRRDAILAAKGIVSYVLGALATVILMVAGAVLMDADWGPWLGVSALVLAAVLTAVALMAVVAGIAKTAEGASGVQAIVAVGLAMLGGSWFPVASEGILGVLSQLTPHYWFLEGLDSLAGADSGSVVLPHVAALVAIAVVVGVPATVLLRRRLTP
ncbi:ABC transporter permease [Actinobacteria bacterium YIM 96077]|uniref:ABC transmembrane type-2 domain-containing protein n=1 Tax=Phytoactinopolyspora halophila TaxID=1981511 RepID=A0A329R273_9ACTN|nr:ABC transporter permease [Phytoactinopolyspora halophila]AYY12012.1 ABC transporter permease [Actinobacteria bacterium YIM 96077]RAW18754.1 hypothetical protein DPM12_01410 [Phytoactinopolyspora halophila]